MELLCGILIPVFVRAPLCVVLLCDWTNEKVQECLRMSAGQVHAPFADCV